MYAESLNIKSYGSIPHLPGSRLGSKDKVCSLEQAWIATRKVRDECDRVIVQEKLDGSNVGVIKLEGVIYPITRSGNLATTSPYRQHHLWAEWVYARQHLFLELLEEGERLCGEWLAQAHGTKYQLIHDPFVAFDLIRDEARSPFGEFVGRVKSLGFVTPYTVYDGEAISAEQVLKKLGVYGFHGAIDPIEGAIWRVERKIKDCWQVDFLCKYVCPDKVNGCYLFPSADVNQVWNVL